MPETYSNGKAPSESERQGLPWFSASLDWPYEMVGVEAQVTATRRPNVMEWAVLRILEEFPEDLPTLVEAAQQLGIMEPAFLTDTIRRLIEGGIIERQGPEGELEFAGCRLTEKADDFLNARPSGQFPERHGLKLYFDGITGEHMSRPPRLGRSEPKNPIISAAQLPPPRTDLGLDRTRHWAHEQREPFLAANSEIKEVKVLDEQGGYLWAPVRIEVSIDNGGKIQCQISSGSEAQRAWFDQLPADHPVFERVLRQAVLEGWSDAAVSERPFPLVRQETDRLIAPVSLEQEALELIRNAQNDILLHSLWLKRASLVNALRQATGRGIHCRSFGTATNLGYEFLEEIEMDQDAGDVLPVVLIVDGCHCLRLDRVLLRIQEQNQREFIVPSLTSKMRTLDLYQQLLDQTNVV